MAWGAGSFLASSSRSVTAARHGSGGMAAGGTQDTAHVVRASSPTVNGAIPRAGRIARLAARSRIAPERSRSTCPPPTATGGWWPLLASAAALLLATGCGGGGDGDGAGSRADDRARAPEPSKPPRPEARPRAEKRGSGRLPTELSKQRTTTTKSGAIVILPPRPTATVTTPDRRCEARRQQNKRQGPRLFPPAPGLRARRAGSEVIIAYRFARVDRRCRPSSLQVNADVTDDRLPPTGKLVVVRRRRGVIRLPLPPDLRRADAVSATARTQDGRPSRATTVLIR